MSRVTLINPFEVPEGRADEFVASWREAANFLRRQEGFVSTHMRQSLDPGATFQFVNVAIWESVEDFQKAMNQPEFRKIAGDVPFPSHPALYRTVVQIP